MWAEAGLMTWCKATVKLKPQLQHPRFSSCNQAGTHTYRLWSRGGRKKEGYMRCYNISCMCLLNEQSIWLFYKSLSNKTFKMQCVFSILFQISNTLATCSISAGFCRTGWTALTSGLVVMEKASFSQHSQHFCMLPKCKSLSTGLAFKYIQR